MHIRICISYVFWGLQYTAGTYWGLFVAPGCILPQPPEAEKQLREGIEELEETINKNEDGLRALHSAGPLSRELVRHSPGDFLWANSMDPCFL